MNCSTQNLYVRYKWEFVITEFVITKFDCITKYSQKKKSLFHGHDKVNLCQFLSHLDMQFHFATSKCIFGSFHGIIGMSANSTKCGQKQNSVKNLFAANSFVSKKALKLKVNCDIIQQ